MWFHIAITKIMVVATSIDFDLNDLTVQGILRVAFDPYFSVFGEFTWGIIFGFIGAGLYINERSIGSIATFLILVGVFATIILPSEIIFLFSIILAFIITTIFYITFIESKTV